MPIPGYVSPTQKIINDLLAIKEASKTTTTAPTTYTTPTSTAPKTTTQPIPPKTTTTAPTIVVRSRETDAAKIAAGLPIVQAPKTTTQPIPPKTATTIDNTAFNQYVNKLAADNPMFRGLVNAARSGVEIKPVVAQSGFELQQQTSKQTQVIISQLESQRAGIIPSSMYYIEGRKIPKPGSLLSIELLIYEKQALKQQEEFNKQISNYPVGTTFKQTPRGYDVILPKIDTMADSRKQIATANALNKITPGLGEGYKALYGAWGSAVETGRSIYNLGVSAIDWILPGQGQNLRAVTESDITIGSGIFKQKMLGSDYNIKAVPSIWTGEGRDILSKLGTPGYIGAGVFEAGSFYVGGKLLEPFVAVGGTVFKGASNRLLTSSLLRGTTEEITTESGRIITTKTPGMLSKLIPDSVMGTKTMQNFEKWAVEGYRPGKTLVEVSKGFPIKTGEWIKQPFNLEVDKSIGFWNRRIWLSPTEQASYASRIAKQGTMNIGFPTSRDVGKYFGNIGKSGTREGFAKTGTKLTMAGERETFQTGFRGGIKGRTSTTFLKEDILGTELGTAKGGSQTYKITDLVQPWKENVLPKLESSIGEYPNPWQKGSIFYKTMQEQGGIRAIPLESGKININEFSGFGKQAVPLSEKAIWGLRKPGILSKEGLGNFLKDIRASQSELISLQKPSSILSKSGRLSGVTFDIPSEAFGRGLSYSLSTGALGTIKIPTYGQGKINAVYQIPKIKLNQISSNRDVLLYQKKDIISVTNQNIFSLNIPKTNQIQIKVPIQEYINISKLEQVQIKVLKQDQIRITIPKLDLIKEQITTPVNIKIPRYEFRYPSTMKFKTPLWSLPSNLGGGGGRRQLKSLSLGYRFRKWKTPRLEDLLGGWK